MVGPGAREQRVGGLARLGDLGRGDVGGPGAVGAAEHHEFGAEVVGDHDGRVEFFRSFGHFDFSEAILTPPGGGTERRCMW